MSKPMFVCSIDPDGQGHYSWFVEKEGKTFGGKANSQQEAIAEAFKILSPVKKLNIQHGI